MKSAIALPAFVAVVAAQAETFSFGSSATRVPSSTIEQIVPSVTETASGPIDTGKACAEISRQAERSRFKYPSVEAEVSSKYTGF